MRMLSVIAWTEIPFVKRCPNFKISGAHSKKTQVSSMKATIRQSMNKSKLVKRRSVTIRGKMRSSRKSLRLSRMKDNKLLYSNMSRRST